MATNIWFNRAAESGLNTIAKTGDAMFLLMKRKQNTNSPYSRRMSHSR
ncbi:hypothetical protein JCM19233_1178 [Vibrio astriarenae]|nr:hypothetical protein JCM19233_1178 [Vibrio sp. C7]